MFKLGGFKYSEDVHFNNGCDQLLKRITEHCFFHPCQMHQLKADALLKGLL